MAPKDKMYLTPNEVAELLMVSPITVRQWAQRGDLAAHTTPGGHRRFLREDLEKFARDRGLALAVPADGPPRLLIVDDDEQLANYLKEVVSTASPDTVAKIALDGYEAGRMVQTFMPQIVLLDLMMPGLNGYEVCQRIKDDPATRNIRVFAMTGFYTPENEARVISAGAECCMSKPIDKVLLLSSLGFDTGAQEPVAK